MTETKDLLNAIDMNTMRQLELVIQQSAYNHTTPESLDFMKRELSFRKLEKFMPETKEQIQFIAVMLQLFKIYKFYDSLEIGCSGKKEEESQSEREKPDMYR